MIWIDRLAFVCASMMWVILALLLNGEHRPMDAFGTPVLLAVGVLIGVPWLFLRGMYFVVTGRLTPARHPLLQRDTLRLRGRQSRPTKLHRWRSAGRRYGRLCTLCRGYISGRAAKDIV